MSCCCGERCDFDVCTPRGENARVRLAVEYGVSASKEHEGLFALKVRKVEVAMTKRNGQDLPQSESHRCVWDTACVSVKKFLIRHEELAHGGTMLEFAAWPVQPWNGPYMARRILAHPQREQDFVGELFGAMLRKSQDELQLEHGRTVVQEVTNLRERGKILGKTKSGRVHMYHVKTRAAVRVENSVYGVEVRYRVSRDTLKEQRTSLLLEKVCISDFRGSDVAKRKEFLNAGEGNNLMAWDHAVTLKCATVLRGLGLLEHAKNLSHYKGKLPTKCVNLIASARDLLLCRDSKLRCDPYMLAVLFGGLCGSEQGGAAQQGIPSRETINQDPSQLLGYIVEKARGSSLYREFPKPLLEALAHAYIAKDCKGDIAGMGRFLLECFAEISGNCGYDTGYEYEIAPVAGSSAITSMKYEPPLKKGSVFGKLVVAEQCDFELKRTDGDMGACSRLRMSVEYVVGGTKKMLFSLKARKVEVTPMVKSAPDLEWDIYRTYEWTNTKESERKFYVTSAGSEDRNTMLAFDIWRMQPQNSAYLSDRVFADVVNHDGFVSSLLSAMIGKPSDELRFAYGKTFSHQTEDLRNRKRVHNAVLRRLYSVNSRVIVSSGDLSCGVEVTYEVGRNTLDSTSTSLFVDTIYISDFCTPDATRDREFLSGDADCSGYAWSRVLKPKCLLALRGVELLDRTKSFANRDGSLSGDCGQHVVSARDFFLCRDGSYGCSPYKFAELFERLCSRNARGLSSRHSMVPSRVEIEQNPKRLAEFLVSRSQDTRNFRLIPAALFRALARAYVTGNHDNELEGITSFIKACLNDAAVSTGYAVSDDCRIVPMDNTRIISSLEHKAPTSEGDTYGELLVVEQCDFNIENDAGIDEGSRAMVRLSVRYGVRSSEKEEALFAVAAHGADVTLMTKSERDIEWDVRRTYKWKNSDINQKKFYVADVDYSKSNSMFAFNPWRLQGKNVAYASRRVFADVSDNKGVVENLLCTMLDKPNDALEFTYGKMLVQNANDTEKTYRVISRFLVSVEDLVCGAEVEYRVWVNTLIKGKTSLNVDKLSLADFRVCDSDERDAFLRGDDSKYRGGWSRVFTVDCPVVLRGCSLFESVKAGVQHSSDYATTSRSGEVVYGECAADSGDSTIYGSVRKAVGIKRRDSLGRRADDALHMLARKKGVYSQSIAGSVARRFSVPRGLGVQYGDDDAIYMSAKLIRKTESDVLGAGAVEQESPYMVYTHECRATYTSVEAAYEQIAVQSRGAHAADDEVERGSDSSAEKKGVLVKMRDVVVESRGRAHESLGRRIPSVLGLKLSHKDTGERRNVVVSDPKDEEAVYEEVGGPVQCSATQVVSERENEPMDHIDDAAVCSQPSMAMMPGLEALDISTTVGVSQEGSVPASYVENMDVCCSTQVASERENAPMANIDDAAVCSQSSMAMTSSLAALDIATTVGVPQGGSVPASYVENMDVGTLEPEYVNYTKARGVKAVKIACSV